MKHVTPYSVFEASAAAPAALTPEQVEWLNQCTEDTWKLNPQTGLVDVDGSFDCSEQGLSEFKGVRFGVVRGCFNCEKNLLTSLVGAPEEVEEYFECSGNHLTSLEGAPRKVGMRFWCHKNTVSCNTLESIFFRMKGSESYLKAVESLWSEIPVEDQVLLYRPEFKWVGAEEAKKLQAVGRFNKIKGIL